MNSKTPNRSEGLMTTAFAPIPAAHEAIVKDCIGAAIRVHRELGPGFREVIYKRALYLELDSRGFTFECEKKILVRYRDWLIPGQTVDLIVADTVLIEIKSLPRVRPRHRKQVLSYLRSTDVRIALLMNFNAPMLKAGLERFVK